MRTFDRKAVPKLMGEIPFFEVPNPKPAQLVRFAASTVWKFNVSPRRSLDIDLGPWELSLRRYVFEGAGTEPRLMVMRRPRTIDGVEQTLAYAPMSAPSFGKRAYAFELRGFLWLLRLDQRMNKSRSFFSSFAANDADPVIVPSIPKGEIEGDETLLRVVAAADRGGRRLD